MRIGRETALAWAAVVAFVILFTAAIGARVQAQTLTQLAKDLSELSLEELGNVQITSVSKRPEPLSKAAAAIYVITNDDIRRSGATTLAEALRLAPNLQVARGTGLDYAITARGFNSLDTANKLLVMVDGRSVYTPLHAGVFWDAIGLVMEDVERIEVISGPGGTLWGANAVNGVVNVITKTAHATQGGLVDGQLGIVDRGAAVRYGAQAGDAAYRVYGLGYDRGHTATASGGNARDEWSARQAGFRTDWGVGQAFTLQGDTYRDPLDPSGALSGSNLLARWTRPLANGSTFELQTYYDEAERQGPGVRDFIRTLDAQAQHTRPIGTWNEIVWGGGIRFNHDEFANTRTAFVLVPPSRDITLGNLFVQDSIALADDLTLTLGTKFEHSSYSGLEHLPSARLGWRATDTTFLWSAISRAVRTPSRVDRDLVLPGVLAANTTFESESLIAYEVGYRGQPLPRTTLSVSLFYNDYDELRTLEPPAGGGLPLRFGNRMEGHTHGVEVWADHLVNSWWRLSAGANLLRKSFRLKPGSGDVTNQVAKGNDPDFQAQLRSYMSLTDTVDLTIALRAVDDLPNPAVPGYVEADFRIGWKVAPNLDLSLGGFNLLDAHHPESEAAATRTETRRTVYVGARWKF